MKKFTIPVFALMCFSSGFAQYSHQVNADNLGRGLVAVKTDNGVMVSWRSLVTDDKDLAFDVYRDGVKITDKPVSLSTCFVDPEGTAGAKYSVKGILGGDVKETSEETAAWESFFKRVHLNRPEGGTSPAGGKQEQRDYTYTPDDVSVGDVDGDGEYELIVKWFPTNAADNSHYRYTGNTILDCYKMDGTQLWRIDLGRNIRSGNHYTQFMLYDFDGDGKAELICRTAPGTVDGKGKNVLMGTDTADMDFRRSDGQVIKGSEYLTVFNGLTGAEIHTIAYNPPHDIRKFDKSSQGWGDNYGGRSERFLAGVAYLDGKKPSAVFCRGYYTASYVWAVDFDGEKLTEKWFHKSETAGKGLYGEGAHSLTIGDVDGDGCDEIVYGAASLDHDGSLLYRTGIGHGDALHLTDMLPEREGLEVFMPHEDKSSNCKWDIELRDARTGEILYGLPQSGKDVGRGLAANITDKYDGYEYWSTSNGNVYSRGEVVGTKRPSVNFRIYWDGDLLDELLDGTLITKPNRDLTAIDNIINFSAYGNAESCNSTKKTPNLQADLFGDWREEVILHDGKTQSDLIIFTTPIPTEYKVPCLMQDRQYRLAIAWQNVAYNQPPHLSYNLESKFDTRAGFRVKSGMASQNIFLGDEMKTLVVSIKNATGIKAEGLPEGISFSFDEESMTGTLSGTPVTDGNYVITLTTTGAVDGTEATMTVTLNVKDPNKFKTLAKVTFDEASDVIKNHVSGTLTPTGQIKLTEGKVSNAIEFDGSYYLSQPVYDELQMGENDFTIELWYKSTDDDGYLFCIGTHNTTNVEGGSGNWIGLEKKQNQLTFSIDSDGASGKSDASISTADKYFDGEWHHIALVREYARKRIRMYIDGKEAITNLGVTTGPIRFNPTELFFIGGDDEPTPGKENRTFNGLIDEFVIYDAALSAAIIKQHYEDAASGVESITDASTLLGDADSATLYDAAGNVIRKAYGSGCAQLTEGLGNGIYIIVTEKQGKIRSKKIVI